MTEIALPLSETSRRQRLAGDPGNSAWVSANAGSGKTYVLSRRVIRLMLSGCDPAKILCLTFTKAAAAEMSNRVFGELARWTTLSDAELGKAIAEMDGVASSQARLATARRLFTRALETPGGLKIQTIHGFCEAILHQFPLEANVAGHFEVLEGLPKERLLQAAQDEVLLIASAAPGSPLGRALTLLLDRMSDQAFSKALKELIQKRDGFQAWKDRAIKSGDDVAAGLRAALARSLGVAADVDADTMIATALDASWFTPERRRALLTALRASSATTDQKTFERLAAAFAATEPQARFGSWQEALFTQKGEPRTMRSFATATVAKPLGWLEDVLAQEQARMTALNETIAAADTLDLSGALFVIGEAILTRFQAAKAARGALDYEDLIVRTANLLANAEAAAWVQFKLDRGIDHILVDEAQDTSPRQWQVVRALADEFFAGDGARAGVLRTVFAVGDEKQSIYSFQGAEPRQFGLQRQALETKARGAGRAFESVRLGVSFRSTPDVLAAVDRVFADLDLRAGVVANPGDYEDHTANRFTAPGFVEIWPAETKNTDKEPEDWLIPLDSPLREPAETRVAGCIAKTIAHFLRAGERLDGTGAPIRAGDCLILVRKRGPFVTAVTRALKEYGVPVAGADRLAVTGHIAVLDLMALGRVLLLPDDDLSLAAVLKSPLYGWDDERLMALAHGRAGQPRPGRLWDMLEAEGAVEANARHAFDSLTRLKALAETVAPFELYARVLGPEGGRRRFVERLGVEAEDLIDEFLALALTFERSGPPTLEAFLAGLQGEAPDVKRETEAARDEVRVMTVHGAKGLEAPVVFLVDSGAAPTHSSHLPVLIPLAAPDDPEAAPALALRTGGRGKPGAVAAAIDDWQQAQDEESRRLLYVAMTRAADRLYVCGFAGGNGAHERSWHAIIARALEADAERLEPVVIDDGAAIGQRWRAKHQPALPAKAVDVAAETAVAMPDWLDVDAEKPVMPLILQPSSAVDLLEAEAARARAAARNALDEQLADDAAALVLGRAVHKLLELLPDVASDQRAPVAGKLAERLLPGADAAERARLIGPVLALLEDPRFAPVFAEGSRAEVAVSGTITDRLGRRHQVSGRIDRLAVTADAVLIVDFKTNRVAAASAGDVSDDYVAQLAIYAHLMAAIYPGRAVKAALVYSAGPVLVEIDAARLETARARMLG